MVKILVCRNYEEMSAKATEVVASAMKAKPACVLGLATGSTPEGLYENLVYLYGEGMLDFSAVRTVNLDEYYPLSPENKESYRYYMNSHLFDHVNIDKKNTHIPNGQCDDPNVEGRRYDALLGALGGVDLQILGVGRNGHIGFNEPAETLEFGTHVTALTESTIHANSRLFDRIEDVPRHAITMGIGSIFKAQKIVIMASGSAKSAAVAKLLQGNLDTHWPVTVLALHPDVTLICDRAAMGQSEESDE